MKVKKQTILNESGFEKIDESNKDKNLKAFNIKVIENSTGRELINEDTDFIAGVLNSIKNKKEDQTAIACYTFAKTDIKTRFNSIEAMTNLIADQKKNLVKTLLMGVLDGLFGGDNE